MNKPILFNTEMVKAILEGRNTVTRRVIKPQPTHEQPNSLKGSTMWWGNKMFAPPYSVGDILWVRETFNSDWCDHTIYKSDGGSARDAGYSEEPKWHPSIHMPKTAARIFLRVTGVRAERLQEITGKDIEREGLYCDAPYTRDHFAYAPGMMIHWRKLWNSTIKPADTDRYGWDANPYVWVISFERCEKPEGFDS